MKDKKPKSIEELVPNDEFNLSVRMEFCYQELLRINKEIAKWEIELTFKSKEELMLPHSTDMKKWFTDKGNIKETIKKYGDTLKLVAEQFNLYKKDFEEAKNNGGIKPKTVTTIITK
jgi:hypothetical protein